MSSLEGVNSLIKDFSIHHIVDLVMLYSDEKEVKETEKDQNNLAFYRFWTKIYLILKERCPKIRLIVIGANPHIEMINLVKNIP